MKCAIRECDEQATFPFNSCNSLHGMMLKIAKSKVRAKLEGEENIMADMNWKAYFDPKEPTDEDIKHYSQYL